MKPNYDELPDEIWEIILNQLGDDHHSELESLSLVSKRMLSITNHLRLRFTVVDQAYIIHGTIHPYIYRFKNLQTLDLSKLEHSNFKAALTEIGRSPVALKLEVVDISNQNSIPIESLKALGSCNRNIRVLKCANVVNKSVDNMRAIARFLPNLEELDISDSFHIPRKDVFSLFHRLDDAGIESLSTGLKNLIKINISNNLIVTDKSLIFLSSNCLRLQEISFKECTQITIKGVLFMLHNSPNLRSISMTFRICGSDSIFIDPVTSTRRLSTLRISGSDISDELLDSIVKAHFPLESVSISDDSYFLNGHSLHGLSSFLHAYHSLKFLSISKNTFLSDKSIINLSRYLHDLVSVKLNSCYKLTSTALLALINNCSFLVHIEMKHTNLGLQGNSSVHIANYLHTKSRIKSLNLGWNSHLSDELLLKISSVCPNLKHLDVSSCPRITWSVGEILQSYPEIEHLKVQGCGGVTNIVLKIESFRLKKLYMARSGLNDDGLLRIAASCNELVKIDLEGCRHVTTGAVKFMVKNCEKLREVNLRSCPNVHACIVDWILHSRPSLRKLVPPLYYVIKEDQRQYMLRHGCQI